MYLTQISKTGTIAQNNPIEFASTPTLKTNNNVSLNDSNDGFLISVPGVYKVRLQANFESSGTDIGAEMYANSEAISATAVTVSVADNSSGEIVIEYPVNVTSTPAEQTALIQFYALESAILLNGYATIERIS